MGDTRTYNILNGTGAQVRTEINTALNDMEAQIATISGNGGVASSVANQLDSSALSFWKGTQAEYDAIASKDASTVYFIEG